MSSLLKCFKFTPITNPKLIELRTDFENFSRHLSLSETFDNKKLEGESIVKEKIIVKEKSHFSLYKGTKIHIYKQSQKALSVTIYALRTFI